MLSALRSLSSGVIVLLSALPAAAHHSFAEFDLTQTIEVHGVVEEVWFNNPHIHYYLSATAEDGSQVSWDIYGSAPNNLVRQGWTRDSVKAGDVVTMVGNPAKQGVPRISLVKVIFADGRTLQRE
ncbi:MAG: hypothetical protein H6978_07395 [Gammaproteobacteria bacterium]|nr:hypothetical protein [Gammaproteobacteria bacterium]